MTRLGTWLDTHYNRILDFTLFLGYVGIGLALAYGPTADSTRFIQNLIYGTDRRFIGLVFFVIPSALYLLPGLWVVKFGALAPLAFVLGGIGWFALITPNRSVFIVVVFALTLARMAVHYGRLILAKH